MKRKIECPMAAIMNCIEDRCAWYVGEKNSCAVKLIAVDRLPKSK